MTKSLLKGVLTRLAGSTAIVLLAMGVFGSQPASAQIAGTKHNLGSTGTGAVKFDGTAEICVFCHTPHGADTSAAVPLWNRVLANPNTYTTYNSLGTSSLDGNTAPVGSVSLACLSCHDGATAMNVMINAPGSGGYNATTGTTVSGTWVGSAGGIMPSGITLIGKDLRNDHPIGIQYAGGPKGTSTIPTSGDYTSFKDDDFKTAKSASLNGQQVWWVDTTGGANSVAGSRDKNDMQLYTRASSDVISGTSTVVSTGLATAQPFVECASCHDPHTSANATFLRVTNAGSALCLACHTK